ncbi:sirohydrochlorin ferrochelatase [Kribbella sp. VKM Ac-2527]|uniref:Sirohydrochlorin ferrochelatase n=1 Tax=Kribbella caucasensis TaxID=2512215 RepID=A0A4R6K4A5_9ACTN|nr:CbiX/SirB N-terminal domain-containing protein [Kribbella sp. VKM Ac-2527]TDO44130.1 sirohydrochlorin ferrochelatase [Kribbella sp. VKM Ac-2527]
MIDLVATAHGTADPRGIREVHSLVRMMSRLRPDVPMSLGFVDVDLPDLPSLVSRVVADSNQAVVVPLLLSSGYHISVDVAAEVTRRPGFVVAAGALGPDPVLADVLASRLGSLRHIDRIVMAAAGSSDHRALLDCSAVAASLASLVDRPVEVGYVSGAGERLSSVLSRSPRRTAVATYMLAPGYFADRVRHLATGRPVTPPLGADPRIAELALTRYEAALTTSLVSTP